MATIDCSAHELLCLCIYHPLEYLERYPHHHDITPPPFLPGTPGHDLGPHSPATLPPFFPGVPSTPIDWHPVIGHPSGPDAAPIATPEPSGLAFAGMIACFIAMAVWTKAKRAS